MRTNLVGLALTVLLSAATPLLTTVDLGSVELMGHTQVGLESVLLALASGVGGALSVTAGLSSALVGVMVAVALMPPAVAFGILLSLGDIEAALGR